MQPALSCSRLSEAKFKFALELIVELLHSVKYVNKLKSHRNVNKINNAVKPSMALICKTESRFGKK